MRHLEALVVKFLMVAVILEIVLRFMTTLTFGQILTVALTVTIVSYLIGDLLVLRFTGNFLATIADFVVILFTVYAFNSFFYRPGISFMDAFWTALILGVAEAAFHRFVNNRLHYGRGANLT